MITIFLLTGWGVNIKALTPLQKKLESHGYRVLAHELPYTLEAEGWLVYLAEQLPAQSYWLGYSLGGQLLSALTLTHHEQCSGLITLGSNVSFSATPSWEYAMPVEVFNSFKNSYQQSPMKTVKRFRQLVAKGDKNSKEIVAYLTRATNKPEDDYETGLLLLESLNNKEALKIFTKPQYHLFAENDALVPLSCMNALQFLVPNASMMLLTDAGHCFPMSRSEMVASAINQFIRGDANVT